MPHDACLCGALSGVLAASAFRHFEDFSLKTAGQFFGKQFWQLVSKAPCITPILSALRMLPLKKFPLMLGPFSLIPLPGLAGEHGCASHLQSGMSVWQLDIKSLPMDVTCDSDAEHIFVKFSDLSQLHMSSARKQDYGIPPQARSFRWAYPVVLANGNFFASKEGHEDGEAMKAFFDVGGFVYYGDHGHCVHISTFAPCEAGGRREPIRFATPKRWLRRWSRKLESALEFHPITLKHIHEYGAKDFCYLLPNDKRLQELPENEHPHIPFGAFVYRFKNPLLDRYFAVVRENPFVVERHSQRVHVQISETFHKMTSSVTLSAESFKRMVSEPL